MHHLFFRLWMQRPPTGVAVPKPAASIQASGSAVSGTDSKWGSQAVFRPKKEKDSPVPGENKEKVLAKESPRDSPASSRDKKEKKDKKHDDSPERKKEGKDKEKKLKKGHSMSDVMQSPSGGRSSLRYQNLKELWAAPTTSLLMRDTELIRNVAHKLNEGV